MIVADTTGSGEESNPRRASPGLAINLSLFAGLVSTAVIYDALPPILPSLSAHFGGGQVGDLIAQLTTTLPLFGMALSGLVAGLSIERFGVKPVLLVALIVFSAVGSAGSVLTSAVPLLATRLLTGMASGTMLTCGTSLIANNFKGLARSRRTGYLYSVGAICSMTFVLIAGSIAQISWRAPFVLHFLLGLIFLIPIVCLPHSSLDRMPRRQPEPLLKGFALLGPAVPAYVCLFALNVLGYLFSVALVFLLRSVGTESPIVIARVSTGYALAAFVGTLFVGKAEETIGPVNSIRVGFALLAVGCAVCAIAPGVTEVAAGAVIGGLGIGICVPATINSIMRTLPPELAARGLGVGTTVLYLGGSSAPILLEPVSILVGIRGSYYAIASCIFFCLLVAMGQAVGRKIASRNAETTLPIKPTLDR